MTTTAQNRTKITAEPGKQELRIERVFDAPRELVFKAHTDPKLFVQWLGPKKYSMTLEKFEPRKGGMWRYTSKGPEGEFAFHGVYHEVVAPSRMVQTSEFEGFPGHVQLETLTLEDHEGKTRLSVLAVFQSVADRDGLLQNGMEGGLNESYVRLTELLEKMQK